MQFVFEITDKGTSIPFTIGSSLFYTILAAVPVYSFFQQQAHITRQNLAFARFVPQEFLASIGREEAAMVKLGDQVERHLTILFSDIRSFTTISEKMTPEENIDFVNRYLSRMGPIVRSHGGFVDKYIGDAIMALFQGDAIDAVACGRQMLEALDSLNAEGALTGLPAVHIGIGIHSGRTMLGIVGEKERYQGTVISDAVNLAARLESLTKRAGVPILMSEVTHQLLADRIPTRYVGSTKVKGKTERTLVFTTL